MEQDKNLTAEIQQEETLVGTIPPVTFDEFTPPSYEEWKQEVVTALKGGSFEKRMFTKTYEGITLNPIYRLEDQEKITHNKTYPGMESNLRGANAGGYIHKVWTIAPVSYTHLLMGDGLQRAAGEKLQKILEALTGVLIVGVALGAAVTAVLQSSSATTVMTVGLVNAGLMTLKQAFGIVMGANIGTTITAQLIAFKLTDYVTLILAIGFAMQLLAKRRRGKYLGQVLLGFGILMLGMSICLLYTSRL